MHNMYLLLRDNRQTGPHSLETLRQLGLKATDLIWIEGKSAGWRNPSEIPELLPEQSAPVPPVSPVQPVAPITQTVPKNNPAKTAGSKHIHVSFPVRPVVVPPAARREEPVPFPLPQEVVAGESPEEKLQRKAEELYRKAQAYSEGKAATHTSKDPDIKYARSLDEIKEEYVHWMSEQKRKKTGSGRKAALASGLLLLLLAGGYFGREYLTGAEPLQKQASLLSAPTETEGTQAVHQTGAGERGEALPSSSLYPDEFLEKEEGSGKKAGASTNPVTGSPVPNQNKAKAPVPAPADKEEEAVLLEETERAIQEEFPENGTERKATRRESKPEAVSPATIAKHIRISEKERDERNGKGITGLYLTVYNNSSQFVNVVAVDVYYYKSEDRLLEKKTLYFNNIPAGSSSSLPAPDNRRAVSVNYQLGLISSAGGLYYAKQ